MLMLSSNFVKVYILYTLFCSTIFAQEIEIVWEKRFLTYSPASSSKPFSAITDDLSLQINEFLRPRKPLDVSDAIPPKILKPSLPPEVKKPEYQKKVVLRQGEFDKYETKEAFKNRVEQANIHFIEKSNRQKTEYESAIKFRNEQIKKLSKKYKADVKIRNAKIVELQKLVSADIEVIKNEQEKKLSILKKYIPLFAKNSFEKYLGNPRIISTDFFANQELMTMTLASDMNGYKESIELNINGDEARRIDEHLEDVTVKIIFALKIHPQKNILNLTFKEIKLELDGTEYFARIQTTQTTHNYIAANIEIDDPTNVSIADQKLDLQEDSLAIELQKSNLKEVTYRVTRNANNEILQRLKTLKAVNKNDKKWLFVIGIEHYGNGVAPIAYSAQSAKNFAKLAQKLLGIPKENSFILIDKDATSGKVKSEFKRMLSLVKQKDSIYFYYSGHGIPVSTQNNEPYILPQDIDPNYIDDEHFYKLKNIYTSLSKSKATKVIAVIDSCFSGSTDGENLIKGVAAARLKPKHVDFDHKKMVVLTAGQGRQYSNMYKEKEQRLFSYYLMSALLENNKRINSLYKDVAYNVERTSRKMGNLKIQQPVMNGNNKLSF